MLSNEIHFNHRKTDNLTTLQCSLTLFYYFVLYLSNYFILYFINIIYYFLFFIFYFLFLRNLRLEEFSWHHFQNMFHLNQLFCIIVSYLMNSHAGKSAKLLYLFCYCLLLPSNVYMGVLQWIEKY